MAAAAPADPAQSIHAPCATRVCMLTSKVRQLAAAMHALLNSRALSAGMPSLHKVFCIYIYWDSAYL